MSSLELLQNATPQIEWAWFSFVRDPLERFLSAVAEVSYRRYPHPPVALLSDGSWSLRRPLENASMLPLVQVSVSRFAPNRTWRTPSNRTVLSTWYPSDPHLRLAMLEFLVVRADPPWIDVHFRPQWASLRAAAAIVPELVSRGFVGHTCGVSRFVDLLQARESEATRARRDALARQRVLRTKTANGTAMAVRDEPVSNRRRHLTCAPYNRTAADHPTSTNATAERERVRLLERCLAAAQRATEQSPYPDDAMAARIRAHYAVDYECLGLQQEGTRSTC